MKLHETLFGRLLAQVMVYALIQASIPPAWAVSLEAPRSEPESPRQQAKPTAFESYAAELSSANPDWDKLQRLAQSFPVIEKPAASRVLGASEMESRKGLLAVNPYVAGSQKWSVNYAGIDLLTGNYSTSATDLSFEGGYGIPINVTRTYSSNNPDDGPLGRGWTLSVDIRTTAGGVLKSPGAPVRSAPVQLFDRPQNEPINSPYEHVPNTLTEGVIAEDASGLRESIQRDVDGILTTPPWDANVYEGELIKDPESEDEYWVTGTQTMTTPEGTVYTYSHKGDYANGGALSSVFDESSDKTPSRVLKVTKIEDRHGNETTFTYGSTKRQYGTANGLVEEFPLTQVDMPNGRQIILAYSSTDPAHVVRISDGVVSEGARYVDYTYWSETNLLKTVTTGLPSGDGGLTTTYDYETAEVPDEEWEGTPAGGLLSSITDPRGLETEIHYVMGDSRMPPYHTWGIDAPQVVYVKSPNGVYAVSSNWITTKADFFTNHQVPWDSGHQYNTFGTYINDPTNSGAWTELTRGKIQVTVPTSWTGDFVVTMLNPNASATNYASPVTVWERIYDLGTGTLEKETSNIYTHVANDLAGTRVFSDTELDDQHKVISEMTYNFLGAPLSKNVKVSKDGGSTLLETETQYAYYGADKYFQQKAMRTLVGGTLTSSPVWRYSFTDYYTNAQYTSGAARGMTKEVYDAKHGSITASSTPWYSSVAAAGTPVAKFEYDAEGRVTIVKKLKSASTSPPTYITTQTAYFGGGVGEWGLPQTVTEDVGGIGRLTETIAYNRAGQAIEVEDAAGRVFETTYNDDGQIESVVRTDTTPDTDIVLYTYGTTDASTGMLVQVYDGLSTATQDIDYFDSGDVGSNPGRLGQVWSVSEYPGYIGSDYYVAYDYNPAGERCLTEYSDGSGDGTIAYRYKNYVQVGSPEEAKRALVTMTKQALVSSAWVDTEQEFHYKYDSAGRLQMAGFGNASTTSAPYYATAPDSRALATYFYDPAGRLSKLSYAWQDMGEEGYIDTNIVKYEYEYDDLKGLRTSMEVTEGDGDGWETTSRTEVYGYDSDLDYLTSVDYNDGLANEAQSWTYDTLGNRSNSGYTYNNLNMMTASPRPGGGTDTYDHDVLGNRTWRNQATTSSRLARYTWDDAGRLLQVAGSSGGATYTYRADGMRMKKVTGLMLNWQANQQGSGGFYNEVQSDDYPTWRYRYDGQMCFEEDLIVQGVDYPFTPTVTGTSYALGARGIDMMAAYSRASSTARTYSTPQYPIYDGHGNMTATLYRTSPGYACTNLRSYDVWGGVRSGSSSGDPNARYCANLGHKQDDESGLIYMRARYHEPETGRFISQDPARDGWNWFVYCANDPLGRVDPDGHVNVPATTLYSLGLLMSFIGLGFASAKRQAFDGGMPTRGELIGYSSVVVATAILAVACFVAALTFVDGLKTYEIIGILTIDIGTALIIASRVAGSWEAMGYAISRIPGSIAMGMFAAHIGMIGGALFCALLGF